MCDTATVSNSTLINASFGLAGLIAGAVITRINSLSIIKRQEFNKAAAEFRSAFVADKYTIQQAIETPSSDDQGFFLMSKLHKGDVAIALEKAKIMFEPYLTATELKGFNAAWKNYIEWPRHFQDDYDNKEKTFEMLRHLEFLLQHAEPK